jgi:hypothetical protein
MRNAEERNSELPVALDAVRLMLLTGFRISEVLGLKHDWINAEGGYIQFPDTKSDGQIRAIGPSAAELLASRPVRKNCPYAFPSDSRDGHFTAAKGCLVISRLIGEQDVERPVRRATRSGGRLSVTESVHREARRVVTASELASRLGPTDRGVKVLFVGLEDAVYELELPYLKLPALRASIVPADWTLSPPPPSDDSGGGAFLPAARGLLTEDLANQRIAVHCAIAAGSLLATKVKKLRIAASRQLRVVFERPSHADERPARTWVRGHVENARDTSGVWVLDLQKSAV